MTRKLTEKLQSNVGKVAGILTNIAGIYFKFVGGGSLLNVWIFVGEFTYSCRDLFFGLVLLFSMHCADHSCAYLQLLTFSGLH